MLQWVEPHANQIFPLCGCNELIAIAFRSVLALGGGSLSLLGTGTEDMCMCEFVCAWKRDRKGWTWPHCLGVANNNTSFFTSQTGTLDNSTDLTDIRDVFLSVQEASKYPTRYFIYSRGSVGHVSLLRIQYINKYTGSYISRAKPNGWNTESILVSHGQYGQLLSPQCNSTCLISRTSTLRTVAICMENGSCIKKRLKSSSMYLQHYVCKSWYPVSGLLLWIQHTAFLHVLTYYISLYSLFILLK